jgi:hypothetical protein
MRKLKLEVDALAVETFETLSAMGEPGTVRAHGPSDTCPANNTCGANVTCGPQTCGIRACVIETDAYGCDGGTASAGCPVATAGCPSPSGALSCEGCTTRNYTNQGGDSCDYCMSFESDIPQRCPCP